MNRKNALLIVILVALAMAAMTLSVSASRAPATEDIQSFVIPGDVQPAPQLTGPVKLVVINTTVHALTSKAWSYAWVTTNSREPYTTADIFVNWDAATIANSASLKYEVSADGTTWYSYPGNGALIGARTTDTTYVTRTTTYGTYVRFTVTAANTQPMTATIKMILR